MKQTAIVAALIVILTSCASNPPGQPAQIDPSARAAVDAFRDQYLTRLDRNKVTGLSLAVVSPEKTLWADAYGWADRGEKVPATVETSYLIGSVTKVFTALAVMQLVDAGAVELDQPYQSYVPEFAMQSRFGPISAITVRHLLTHHAGVSDDVWAGKFSESPADLGSIIEIANTMYTCYPPGTVRVYSNLGYALLGYLVERMSGESYQDYVRDHIFKPLGMEHSGFFTNGEQRQLHAAAYDRRRRRRSELPLLDAPAGAVSSTVVDMARLLQALLRNDGAVISPEALAEMFRLQNLDVALDLDDRAGLCFTITDRAPSLGRVYEHGGATLYHRAQVYVAPEAELAAVVLSNSETGTDTAWMIHEQLMADLNDRGGRTVASSPVPQKLVQFVPRTDTDPETLAGTYAMPGILYEVTARHDMPHVHIDGRRFYLQLQSRDAYVPARRVIGRTVAWPDRWFLFHEVDQRMLMIEAMPWGDLVAMGERVSRSPISDAWEGYYGRYQPITEAGALPVTGDLTLRERDGFATIEFQMLGDHDVQLALRTLSDTEAVTLGLGRLGGETVRVEPHHERLALWFKGVRYVRTP